MINEYAINEFYKLRSDNTKNLKLFVLDNNCFKQQLNFIQSPYRFKALYCPRRAGKTKTFINYICKISTQFTDARIVYTAESRQDAKEIIWDDLKECLDENEIIYKANETNLQITVEKTDAKIWLKGVSTKKEIEKFRGKKYHLVILDEAQAYSEYFAYFVTDILSYCISDFQGTLVMGGTPNETCSGAFFDACHSSRYDVHTWGLSDNIYYFNSVFKNNPNIKSIEEFEESELKLKGLTREDPRAQRELFGRWVRSANKLIYSYNYLCNENTQPPTTRTYQYALGLDLGFEDSDAIVILAYSNFDRNCYLVEEFKKSKLSVSEIGVKVKELSNKYNTFINVADCGALGKKIVDDINSRYGLALVAAEKERKFDFIELLNDEMKKGFVKIPISSQTAKEMLELTKDEKAFSIGKLKEDDRSDNHLCDAFLYAWRHLYNYLYKEPIAKKSDYEIMIEKENNTRNFFIDGKYKDKQSEYW